MGIAPEQDRGDAVMKIAFGDTAAAGSHTGCNPLGSVIGSQFDRKYVPAHFCAALALLIEQTLVASYPPCLKFRNNHSHSPDIKGLIEL